MNKSLRHLMIRSAHQKVQARRKSDLAKKLFEREVDKIEEEYECSAVKKNSRME